MIIDQKWKLIFNQIIVILIWEKYKSLKGKACQPDFAVREFVSRAHKLMNARFLRDIQLLKISIWLAVSLLNIAINPYHVIIFKQNSYYLRVA